MDADCGNVRKIVKNLFLAQSATHAGISDKGSNIYSITKQGRQNSKV